jgi:hypothetical protein
MRHVTRTESSRPTRPRKSLLIPAAAALVALAAACSSGRAAVDGPPSTVPRTTTTTTVPPRTIIKASGPPTVPFTADRGAITVTAGDPPRGVSSATATALSSSFPGVGTPEDVFRVTGAPIAGTVTLSPSLGAGTVVDAPAWIVPVMYRGIYACPAIRTPAQPPVWASELLLVVVTGSAPGQVVSYQGAGTGPCSPSGAPHAETDAQIGIAN